MKTTDYLDAAKRAAHLPSDYALAKRLGVRPSNISNWRSGRSVPEPLQAFHLAEIAGVDPARMLADIELEKAEKMHRDEQASAWRSILERLGGVAAGVVAAVAVGAAVSVPSPAQAQQAMDKGGLYIMSNI